MRLLLGLLLRSETDKDEDTELSDLDGRSCRAEAKHELVVAWFSGFHLRLSNEVMKCSELLVVAVKLFILLVRE